MPAALNTSNSSGLAPSSVMMVEIRSSPVTIIADFCRSLLLSAIDDHILGALQQLGLRLHDQRIGFHDAEAVQASSSR